MKTIVRFGNTLGIHFVPENHIVAVMRLGIYRRLAGPGFIWCIPLVERVTPLIDTGMRTLSFTVSEALSKDAIESDLDVTVLYTFDPSRSIRSFTAQLVRMTSNEVEKIVQDRVDNCLRQIVAGFHAQQLCEGPTIARVQQTLSRLLAARLRPLGLRPLPKDGVMIKRVKLPDNLLQAILGASRYDITLAALEKYGNSKIDKAVVAEFAHSATSKGEALLPALLTYLGLAGAVSANGYAEARPAVQEHEQPLIKTGRLGRN